MNNHLPISKEMKAVMKNHLSEKYSAAETDEHWKKSWGIEDDMYDLIREYEEKDDR